MSLRTTDGGFRPTRPGPDILARQRIGTIAWVERLFAVVPADLRLGPGSETMIRKLSSGKYRLYSRKKNPKTGRRRNLGTFATREDALKHERAVQYFKRH
jgi:hypothetical protein